MLIELAGIVLVLIALGYALGPLVARSVHPAPRRVTVHARSRGPR